jgi:hypothetical protein
VKALRLGNWSPKSSGHTQLWTTFVGRSAASCIAPLRSESHLRRIRMPSSPRPQRPKRVTLALLAVTIAWIDSAAALANNQLILHGSGVGPGPLLGVVSLVVQAASIVLVARGSAVGRVLVAIFFIVATLPLPMVARLSSHGATMSAAYLVLGFVLKGTATLLLFSGESNRWFDSAPGH